MVLTVAADESTGTRGATQIGRAVRPGIARQVRCLLHKFASRTRHATRIPGPDGIRDVLAPSPAAIVSVSVLEGDRRAMSD